MQGPLEQDLEAERDAAMVLQQKRWRWLPLRSRSLQPSSGTSSWKAWSPFQCLPAARDLVRLSKRSKAPDSLAYKESRAILPDEPLKLDIGSSVALLADPSEEDIKVCEVVEREPSRNEVAASEASLRKLESGQSCMTTQACAEDEEEPLLKLGHQLLKSSSEVEPPIAIDESSEEPIAPVVLDVGFAQVELKKLEAWPKYNFYILAKDGFVTRDGAVALLEYLDFVLHLPDVILTGFVLIYDVRACSCPQLDLVSWIIHYISDPEREQAWHERCVCWKVLVPPGFYFKMAQSVLSFLFTVSPPKCRVFLSTDVDTTKAEDWICYKPEELADTSFGMLSSISSGLFDVFYSEPHASQTLEGTFLSAGTPEMQEAACSEDGEVFYEAREEEDEEEVQQGTAEAQEVANSPQVVSECADSLVLPFATISQGFNTETGTGYLTIMGHDGPMSDEGLGQVMDFMDDFVNSANAEKGYSVTYDLRTLCIPSISMVMRVAEWGSQPDRQAKWNLLNTACKLVLPKGLKYSIAKGLLNSFFYICPPVCRTLLVTDPDEPDESATVFEPMVASQTLQEDSQSEEPEAPSDDGSSICGRSADTSETTASSACGGMPRPSETEEDELRGSPLGSFCEQQKKLGSQEVVDQAASLHKQQCTSPVHESSYSLHQHLEFPAWMLDESAIVPHAPFTT